MSQFVNKKKTLELILDIYTQISELVSEFKDDIENAIAMVDTLDLTNISINTEFAENYNDLITTFINSLSILLNKRKDPITDDGSLIINPVNIDNNIFTTKLWFSNIQDMTKYQRVFQPNIICTYDNISIEKIINDTTSNVEKYNIYVYNKVFSIYMSYLLNLNSDLSDLTALRTAVKVKLIDVLHSTDSIHNLCTKNIKLINYSNQDFTRIFTN